MTANIVQIHGDTEPSPVVLGEQTTTEKTTQRFQKSATTLADLNAEGLNVQTVNDLLTMYVGAASQHVLRVSFVPEQEDRFSPFGPVSCTVTLPRRCFFYLSSLVVLEWDLLFNVMRLSPWRAWQSIIPALMATTQSPDTDSLFSSTPLLRDQLAQLQSTLSQQMN